MRQLTFIKKGRVEWRQGPEPRLAGPLQAIVRPFVAARCDGDCVPLFRSLTNLVNGGIALHFLDPVVTDVFGPNPFRGRLLLATNALPRCGLLETTCVL